MLPTNILNHGSSKILLSHIITRSIAKTSKLPRPAPRHWRLWSLPGEFVYRKDILARQWTMRWLPGLNAGINEHRVIYALCDGIMILSEEKFDPDWDHPIVQSAFKNKSKEKEMAPGYARYIHVIPKKPVSEFKLIDLV